MKEVKLGGKSVRLYDSIDEMPIVNFQRYNKYLLIDSGIGSDVDDISQHVTRIARLIRLGDKKKALQELQNMQQNMLMISSGISPKYFAFAALIKDVDGKSVNDLSDDGLRKLVESLSGARHSTIVSLLEWLKKKVFTELETYFPEDFSSAQEKENYDDIRRRTLYILDSVINGSDTTKEVEAIDDKMLSKYKPGCFEGSKSDEIKYDKQFENMCLVISQKLNADAKRMTVLQFYNAADMVKRQAEAEAKSYKPIKRK